MKSLLAKTLLIGSLVINLILFRLILQTERLQSSDISISQSDGSTPSTSFDDAALTTRSLFPYIAERKRALDALGYSKDKQAAALVPLINSTFAREFWRPSEVPSEADNIRLKRRNSVRDLFGFDPTKEGIDEDPMNVIKRGFRYSYPKEDVAKADFFKALCGIKLTKEEKQKIYDEHSKGSTNANGGQSTKSDDWLPERASKQYLKYYQYGLSEGISRDRLSQFAGTLYELDKLRLSALNEWGSAQVNESARAAGMRSVEIQMLEHVKTELGPSAVSLILNNGWAIAR